MTCAAAGMFGPKNQPEVEISGIIIRLKAIRRTLEKEYKISFARFGKALRKEKSMALCRRPRCGEIARKDAKKRSACGLRFDLAYEPWRDDGSGIPENARKKERSTKTIAAAPAVFLAVIIAVIIINPRDQSEGLE